MNRGLIGRLRRLEEATGVPARSMALVEVYIGETLDKALIRQGVDRDTYCGLFIVEGCRRSGDETSKGKNP
jgi:hypothetical protein